jgi:hypothetical protein
MSSDVFWHDTAGASEREAVFTGLAQLMQGRRLLHLQLWRDLFYLPNAVHWSFVKPPMPKGVVAALGLAEAVVGIVQTFPRK